MKKIKLTQEKYAMVDDDDYEFLSQFNWYAFKNHGTYRAVRCASGLKRTVYMSRDLMKPLSGMVVDHINGDTLDNRKCNLRVCTSAENIRNRKLHKNSISGYKGVRKQGKNWRATIRANDKRIFLGVFNTKEEAAAAYNEASKKYHGEFARINTITNQKTTKE